MIAPDANLLIYAYNEQATQHHQARQWLESAFSGTEDVGLPMLAVAAFLRIITDKRFPGQTMTMPNALATVEDWLSRPRVRLLHAGDEHWSLLSRLAREAHVSGPILTDTQIAAVALEQGAVIYTTDQDFDRFSQVRTINPLRPRR